MAKTPKFANAKVFAWVDKWNRICTPDKIVVVKGTKKEHLDICEMMVKKGQFIKLNPKTRPDCYEYVYPQPVEDRDGSAARGCFGIC